MGYSTWTPLRRIHSRATAKHEGSGYLLASVRLPAHIAVLFFFYTLPGCQPPAPSADPKPWASMTASHCANELSLLRDPRSNWEIPLDSNWTAETYLRRSRAERIKPYAQVDPSTLPDVFHAREKYGEDTVALNKLLAGYNPHPKVFPFVVLDSVRVGLMQLLRSSGGGYRSHASDHLRLWVHAEAPSTADCTREVQAFYTAFVPQQPCPAYEWNCLNGPMVTLIFDNPGFAHLGIMVRAVVTGYLKAQNSNALARFQRPVCQLSPAELAALRIAYPLRIRLGVHHSLLSKPTAPR